MLEGQTVETGELVWDKFVFRRLFCYSFAIDWIMKQSTSPKNGIRWTSQSQLDDPDFADDLALLSHTQQQMQEKTNIVA